MLIGQQGNPEQMNSPYFSVQLQYYNLAQQKHLSQIFFPVESNQVAMRSDPNT